MYELPVFYPPLKEASGYLRCDWLQAESEVMIVGRNRHGLWGWSEIRYEREKEDRRDRIRECEGISDGPSSRRLIQEYG